jgi:hypothetical protein
MAVAVAMAGGGCGRVGVRGINDGARRPWRFAWHVGLQTQLRPRTGTGHIACKLCLGVIPDKSHSG